MMAVFARRSTQNRGEAGTSSHIFKMANRRESGRIRDISSRKILDSATRRRRQKRQLEALEKDNFQDDPHSHLTVVPAKMKVPAFNDTMEDKRRKRKSKTGELFKQRFRRTFAMLLEEAQQEAEAGEPSYNSANVPPSNRIQTLKFGTQPTAVLYAALIYLRKRLGKERTGFVRVLESPGILLWHLPELESPGRRLPVLESSGNLLNSSSN
ncbi:hypothetical protein ACROYT_G027676 [Oculina patagonica]